MPSQDVQGVKRKMIFRTSWDMLVRSRTRRGQSFINSLALVWYRRGTAGSGCRGKAWEGMRGRVSGGRFGAGDVGSEKRLLDAGGNIHWLKDSPRALALVKGQMTSERLLAQLVTSLQQRRASVAVWQKAQKEQRDRTGSKGPCESSERGTASAPYKNRPLPKAVRLPVRTPPHNYRWHLPKEPRGAAPL